MSDQPPHCEPVERPVVAVLDKMAPAGMARLAEWAVVLPPGETASWLDEADGVIVRSTRVQRPEIERARRLKIIAKHGVGVDNIDVEAARERGIAVTNTPGANSVAVAEMTLALLLAIARSVPALSDDLKAGEWGRARGRLGVELSGRTAGIVGLGNVGSKVGKRLLHGLEMRVLYVDPAVPQEAAVAGCERVASLAELLPRIDVVTLHCPLDETTRGMIGAAELARLRRGALLVNAARGGIVEEAALYDALASGHLRAAASDVFVREPIEAGHPLLSLPNFIATPHIAAGTIETADKVALAAVEAVRGELERRGVLT